MLTHRVSGNISDEATTAPGNIFVEAMRQFASLAEPPSVGSAVATPLFHTVAFLLPPAWFSA